MLFYLKEFFMKVGKLVLCFTATLFIFNTYADLQVPTPGPPAPLPGPSSDFKRKLSDNDRDRPHGQGAYYGITGGFSAYLVNNSATPKEPTSQNVPDDHHSNNKIGSLVSFIGGYTALLKNNFVVGCEVEFGIPVVKPKLILGYMFQENDQFSVNIGYNFLPRIALSEKNKENLILFSGISLEATYQHFFTNGVFARMSIIGEYYSGVPDDLLYGMKLKDKGKITSNKCTALDMKLALSYGIQW
jgi:hypothetical protein